MWPRSAKKWSGHGRPSRPASYATETLKQGLKAFLSQLTSRTDNLADSWDLTLYHHQNARGNLDLALLSPTMRTHLYYYSKYPIMMSSDTTIRNTAAVCFPSQALSIWTIVSYPPPVSILQIVFLTSTCIKLEDEVAMEVRKSIYTSKNYRENDIHSTSVHLLFSVIMHVLAVAETISTTTEAGWVWEAGGYVNKWAGL